MTTVHPYVRLCQILETASGVSAAVRYLYGLQLEFEKVRQESVIVNDKGFSQFDAQYGTYCARWMISNGKDLTGGHLAKWQGKRIAKYWRQLTSENFLGQFETV